METSTLLEIPESLKNQPSKKVPQLRNRWFAEASHFWIQCVRSGEDPHAAGKRIGVCRDAVGRWIRDRRADASPRRSLVVKRAMISAKPPAESVDNLWERYFASAPGSVEAANLMRKIRESSPSIDATEDDEADE
jgi:hypothetical protein